MVTANRTLINKVLYTSEDPPQLVYIHVPAATRPNGTAAQQYLTFDITYCAEIECNYEAMHHPQKVATICSKVAQKATYKDFNYDLFCATPPGRHLNHIPPKGKRHGRTTWVDKDASNTQVLKHLPGHFVNR